MSIVDKIDPSKTAAIPKQVDLTEEKIEEVRDKVSEILKQNGFANLEVVKFIKLKFIVINLPLALKKEEDKIQEILEANGAIKETKNDSKVFKLDGVQVLILPFDLPVELINPVKRYP